MADNEEEAKNAAPGETPPDVPSSKKNEGGKSKMKFKPNLTKKKAITAGAAAVLIAAGFFSWKVFFPGAKTPEKKPPETAADSEKKPSAEKEKASQAPEKEEADAEPADEKFRKTISEFLSDPDWRVRRDAVVTLGQLGIEEFIPELKRMANDPDKTVRKEASKSILLIYSKNKK